MNTIEILARRRAALLGAGDTPILLYSGSRSPRNYPDNTYPFRASSHFLYACGESIPEAWLLIEEGQSTLFLHFPGRDDALWHGVEESPASIGARLGCVARPSSELQDALVAKHPTTLPLPRLADCVALSRALAEEILPAPVRPRDEALAQRMIQARLIHDEVAVAGLREAAEATTSAFAAGRAHTAPGAREATVRARMIARLIERGMTSSFNPIVSVNGEVLHNEHSRGTMAEGDLLLVDFGAETPTGWAADVTRTWPVSGTFSSTQRDLYGLVLEAEMAAIAAVKPGARYRDVHLTAARVIAQGLVDLRILRGDVDGLVEDGVHALFFPHGVGHLLGLDVHDMEDLGDRASYAPGRTRSTQFGLGFLRMDRDLEPGMAVTIEPGFYQVPAILNDPDLSAIAGDRLDRERLAVFSDVRGIRIEDDVLVTETGREVLTAAIPKSIQDVESQ